MCVCVCISRRDRLLFTWQLARVIRQSLIGFASQRRNSTFRTMYVLIRTSMTYGTSVNKDWRGWGRGSAVRSTSLL